MCDWEFIRPEGQGKDDGSPVPGSANQKGALIR